MKITEPAEAVKTIHNVLEFTNALTSQGCAACSLGFQPEINGCCVRRGNPYSKFMIIGEAPGKHEDARSKPFIGPAGKLLDKIWESVGWDTNDWYITNVCLCRPYMPKGSGKENYTPKEEQQQKCRPYLMKQIDLIDPKIIVTLGNVATRALLGEIGSIGCVRGLIQKEQGRPIFPMWHPAYLLRNPNGPAKQQTWDDIRKLKQIVEEL